MIPWNSEGEENIRAEGGKFWKIKGAVAILFFFNLESVTQGFPLLYAMMSMRVNNGEPKSPWESRLWDTNNWNQKFNAIISEKKIGKEY